MDTGADGAKAAVGGLGGGANAIHIATTEDLGGGMRAGTNFEMRFNSASGDRTSSSTGAGLFHNANVFVGGAFGTLRMGKISEASNCGFDVWGCTGGAGMMAGHSIAAGHSSNSLSALVGAAGVANSVSYTTPTINGFSASYQTSVTARANERSALALNYAKGPLTAQVLRTESTGNTAATDAGAANILDGNGESTSIAAGYNFGFARLNVFNVQTDRVTSFTGTAAGSFAAGNVDRDITGLTASMPMGATTLLAGWMKDKKAAADADTKIAVGANYALSKRTTLGADLFKSEAVNAGTGFVVRARHTF
jgi:predicted porin